MQKKVDHEGSNENSEFFDPNSQPGLPFWSNIFKSKNSEKMDIIKILHKIPLFSTLSRREINKVSLIVYERNFKRDEFLFKEGNPGSGMFIIREGSISIEKTNDKTNESRGDICLAHLESGDFLGELSLLDDSVRSASARCIQNTRAIFFSRHDLFDLIEREQILGIKILKELALMIGERLKQTNKSLHDYKKTADNQQKQIDLLEKRLKKASSILQKRKNVKS